jgi:DNA-binding NtrC family response regulator
MLPRLLILDDLFGRIPLQEQNVHRENLCAHFLWNDTTGDTSARASQQKILHPTAEAVFCRAQTPASAGIGDTVENDLESALTAVRKGWNTRHSPPTTHHPSLPWSLVLIDLCFYTGRVTEESHRRTPGMPEGRPGDDDPKSYFGLTLLDAIHREFPELPIFILSSKPRDEVSLEFSRRGALGFIDRSALDGPELLEQALWNHGLLPDSTGEVAGHSLPILLAIREARRAASHRENVLIRGERGSGKELMARYIHRANSKFPNPEQQGTKNKEPGTGAEGPLVPVNSAVFTPNLFASELFGIEPKTATGVDGKVGLIEMARDGDLFLDEIADMPPEVQASMLRVLQERQITRVGARKPRDVDVRFLSATNLDLEDPERKFRPDLLDRLRIGGTIWLPPLRERKEDIPLLVEKFVREAESMRPGIHKRAVTPEAMDACLDYDWPGNIRELRSVIFDAVSRHPDVEHLVAEHLRIEGSGKAKSPTPTGRKEESQAPDQQGITHLLDALRACTFEPADASRWAGSLPELQLEQVRAMARLLDAAIAATKRRTPEHPEGEVLIHPAAKLATGNPKLTASKAADLFKRTLGPLQEELEGDLLEAYEISIRLRPKSPRAQTIPT